MTKHMIDQEFQRHFVDMLMDRHIIRHRGRTIVKMDEVLDRIHTHHKDEVDKLIQSTISHSYEYLGRKMHHLTMRACSEVVSSHFFELLPMYDGIKENNIKRSGKSKI